jgi:hypothetical protein
VEGSSGRRKGWHVYSLVFNTWTVAVMIGRAKTASNEESAFGQMRKSALAATAAIAIVGHSLIYAQQRSNDAAIGPTLRLSGGRTGKKSKNASPPSRPSLGSRLTSRRIGQYSIRSIAIWRNLALSNTLKIKARVTWSNVWGDERMRWPRGTALKHLADAAARLYQSLDDGQKKHFNLPSQLQGSRQKEYLAGSTRSLGSHRQHDAGAPSDLPQLDRTLARIQSFLGWRPWAS